MPRLFMICYLHLAGNKIVEIVKLDQTQFVLIDQFLVGQSYCFRQLLVKFGLSLTRSDGKALRVFWLKW